MDAKTKEVARPLSFETLCLANELSKCKYLDVALSMIEDAFSKELGATSDNSIIVEIMPEGEKPELTEFVNTTDKELLYPELMRLCLEDAKGLQKDKQEKVKYYLDAFIKRQGETNNAQEPQQERGLKDLLPENLKTDEAVRIFKRAIDKGRIKKTSTGLKWVQVGEKGRRAQVAYFCGKLYGYKYGVYCNDGERVSYRECELLFNESRLDRALIQVYEAKKPQSWRNIIDELFTRL